MDEITPENDAAEDESLPTKKPDFFQWTEAALHRSAVRYLQRYPASKTHFLRIMNRKIRRTFAQGADPSQPYAQWLDAVVERCTQFGLLNDAALAQGIAGSLHRRGVSLRAMRQRLRRKGFAENEVETALQTLYEGDDSPDLTAAISYARRRRLGPFGAAERRKENYRKDLQKLARQGFSFNIAKDVLDSEIDDSSNRSPWA